MCPRPGVIAGEPAVMKLPTDEIDIIRRRADWLLKKMMPYGGGSPHILRSDASSLLIKIELAQLIEDGFCHEAAPNILGKGSRIETHFHYRFG